MFKLIEHTADMGIEAEAVSLPGLFVEMAAGLITLMYGTAADTWKKRIKVVVQADGFSELMISWLNEIVYLCESREVVPAAFILEQVSETDVYATMMVQPFDSEIHGVEHMVKAVTYHQAVVEKRQQAWFARVYVDL